MILPGDLFKKKSLFSLFSIIEFKRRAGGVSQEYVHSRGVFDLLYRYRRGVVSRHSVDWIGVESTPLVRVPVLCCLLRLDWVSSLGPFTFHFNSENAREGTKSTEFATYQRHFVAAAPHAATIRGGVLISGRRKWSRVVEVTGPRCWWDRKKRKGKVLIAHI